MLSRSATIVWAEKFHWKGCVRRRTERWRGEAFSLVGKEWETDRVQSQISGVSWYQGVKRLFLGVEDGQNPSTNQLHSDVGITTNVW